MGCRRCGTLVGKYCKEHGKHSCGSCSWNNFKAHFVPIDATLHLNTAPCQETASTAGGSTGKMAHMENIIMLVILTVKWLKLDSDSFVLNNVFFISENVETFICHNCSSSDPHSTLQWEYFLVAIEFVKHTWALGSYLCTEGLEWNLSTNPVLSIVDWWRRNSRTLFRFNWKTDPWGRQLDHSGLLADSVVRPVHHFRGMKR